MTKQVAIIMGSKSDWPIMENVSSTLTLLGIPHEARVLSAHRTPDALFEYLANTNVQVIIAGAGGAAHLPGIIAAKTSMPVIGVPMPTSSLNGMDSLLSIVQMPAGIPVATMAIGKAGAINGALFAASILSLKYPSYHEAIQQFRANQSRLILEETFLC